MVWRKENGQNPRKNLCFRGFCGMTFYLIFVLTRALPRMNEGIVIIFREEYVDLQAKLHTPNQELEEKNQEL